MASKKNQEALTVTAQTVLRVEYADLQEFVRYHTGQAHYDPVSAEEWRNDSDFKFHVDGVVSAYDREQFQTFCDNGLNPSYMLSTILNCLCADGKLEKGTYLVNVCW